ncbi:hypothetical protein CLAIMM_04336, partial [Cladophialophora immunda]
MSQHLTWNGGHDTEAPTCGFLDDSRGPSAGSKQHPPYTHVSDSKPLIMITQRSTTSPFDCERDSSLEFICQLFFLCRFVFSSLASIRHCDNDSSHPLLFECHLGLRN